MTTHHGHYERKVTAAIQALTTTTRAGYTLAGPANGGAR